METNTWSNGFFNAIFHDFNSQIKGHSYQDPKGSVGSQKERKRREKEERRKRKARGEVASLAACREVLQGRSSEFFDFSL